MAFIYKTVDDVVFELNDVKQIRERIETRLNTASPENPITIEDSEILKFSRIMFLHYEELLGSLRLEGNRQ